MIEVGVCRPGLCVSIVPPIRIADLDIPWHDGTLHGNAILPGRARHKLPKPLGPCLGDLRGIAPGLLRDKGFDKAWINAPRRRQGANEASPA